MASLRATFLCALAASLWARDGAAAWAPTDATASPTPTATVTSLAAEKCATPPETAEEPWAACHPFVVAELDALAGSGYTAPARLRAGRDLARRFIGTHTDCARPPDWARGACALLRRYLSLDEPWPEEGGHLPVWTAELHQANRLFEADRPAEAADHTRDAYQSCEHHHSRDPQHCLPLLRDMLDLRVLARTNFPTHDRQTTGESLVMLERSFTTTRLSCDATTTYPVLDGLCEHRLALQTWRAEAYLDHQQYSEAADSYEQAYDICKSVRRTPLECWSSFGRAAWRSRQRVLHAVQREETLQFNRARDLLEDFVHRDMQRTCTEAGLPDPVQRACADLQTLTLASQATPASATTSTRSQDDGPVFVGAAIAPGTLADTYNACLKITPSTATCWPEVRARTIDLSQAIRDMPAPERAAALTKLRQDLDAYLRAANLDCETPGMPPEACSQARQVSQRLAMATRPPPPSPPPPPKDSRALVTGGAIGLALGGAALATMGAGMIWGYQATLSARETRADDPQRSAISLMDGNNFRSGETANKLVTFGAILGGVAVVTGIILLSVDARRRHRLRDRLAVRSGSVAVNF